MVLIIGGAEQKAAFISSTKNMELPTHCQWVNTPVTVSADLCIDFLFDNSEERISALQSIAPIVLINSVQTSVLSIPDSFVRFNGWPGFFEKEVIEASGKSMDDKKKAEDAMQLFNKKISWVSDTDGFVSARIVAMIINEAYLTVEEKVATQDAIDAAMKLGTSYPYGPFEWAQKIGLKNIHDLLSSLSVRDSKYTPCNLLAKEALIK